MNSEIPLFKEYRLDKVRNSLSCIDSHPFNREAQKSCVLSLYLDDEGKTYKHADKSIFRGMVIPSLRHLGLIVGDDDAIRLSANGKLFIESSSISPDLGERLARAILYELDQTFFLVCPHLSTSPCMSFDTLLKLLAPVPTNPFRERLRKWLSMLKQVGLIKMADESYSLDHENMVQTMADIDPTRKGLENFTEEFLTAYNSVRDSAGIADIMDLRERVGITWLRNRAGVLTELQFDALLRLVPLDTNHYQISFGKPMQANEKLFKLGETYYKTVIIRYKGR